ncbi:MAG TPA: hypothetical protein VGD52_25960 [Pseudoduganella sp.]
MSKNRPSPNQAEFEGLGKYDLHCLADLLLENDPAAIERCVRFVIAETRGFWHGRARAMMCRRLKHCELGQQHRAQLVEAITSRLATGLFSEQFKDQLRLAMHLDFQQTVGACREIVISAPRLHTRRYAQWVLLHEREHQSDQPKN